MVSDELMLKIENVSKIYKLGEIGGTTLRESLQRAKAKILKREDPTKKVGAKNYNKGEIFKALDNISFEVKKGERIGIIGHNGAGKSTLLKLISRVTGPTEGNIYLNGRVASMLEVGTGFHPELTGRENVYMNGAILGMTKKEIDAKMEDIIEFSEVRQFIDTPVKRYSSGMYVKLAFSVAAHLDSEIMIMDEVLAVGDMAFQSKCITKMKDVSENNERTILYVSHNMSTIKSLCNRVIVLNKGIVVFDGNVEDGIRHYLKTKQNDIDKTHYDLSMVRRRRIANQKILIRNLDFINTDSLVYERGSKISFSLNFDGELSEKDLLLRVIIKNSLGTAIGSSLSADAFEYQPNNSNRHMFLFDTTCLGRGMYFASFSIIKKSINNTEIVFDWIDDTMAFVIQENDKTREDYFASWNPEYWGDIRLDFMDVK